MGAIATTRTVHRRRQKEAEPALVVPPQLSIPPDYRSGVSLRDFMLAVAGGRPGWMKVSFGFQHAATDSYVQVPSFSTYSHGVLAADADQDILISTGNPHVTLGVYPSPSGGALQVTAVGVVVPISLSTRSTRSTGPGVAAFSMAAPFQAPAPEAEQLAVLSRLVDAGAHLITHAGDRIVGVWRLSRSVSEDEGRRLSAAVARRVPGATLIRDGVVHSTHAIATHGIPEPPPLTYPCPRPQPACRIVPRSEFRAWGVVGETVEPESLR